MNLFPMLAYSLHFKVQTQKLILTPIPLWPAVPGSGDEGTGSRGELRHQAGAGGGEAAVQHSQREPREGAGHHQRAAATEGKQTNTICAQTLWWQQKRLLQHRGQRQAKCHYLSHMLNKEFMS